MAVEPCGWELGSLVARAPQIQQVLREGSHALARPPALKLAEVLAEIRMSPSAFYRLRARDQAPRMIKLPNGELRCRRADLDAWWDMCEKDTPNWQ